MRVSLLGFKSVLEAPLGNQEGAAFRLSGNSVPAVLDRLGDLNTSVLVVSSPVGSEAIEVKMQFGMFVAVRRGIDCSQVMGHPAGSTVEYMGLPVPEDE